MTTAVGMNAALSLDATGVKWPFTPHRRPAALRPTSRPAQMGGETSAPAASADQRDARVGGSNAPVTEGAPRVTAIQGGAEFVALGSASALGLGAHVNGAAELTRRQMLGDVVLVAVWAAIIPGVLWFGHAAGF